MRYVDKGVRGEELFMKKIFLKINYKKIWGKIWSGGLAL